MINKIDSKTTDMAGRILAHFDRSTNAKKRGRLVAANQKQYKLVKKAEDKAKPDWTLGQYNQRLLQAHRAADPRINYTPFHNAYAADRYRSNEFGRGPEHNDATSQAIRAGIVAGEVPYAARALIDPLKYTGASAAKLYSGAMNAAGYKGTANSANLLASRLAKGTTPYKMWQGAKAGLGTIKAAPSMGNIAKTIGTGLHRLGTSSITGAGNYGLLGKALYTANPAARESTHLGSRLMGRLIGSAPVSSAVSRTALGRFGANASRLARGTLGAATSPMGMASIMDAWDYRKAVNSGRLNNPELLKGTRFEQMKDPGFLGRMTAFGKLQDNKEVARIQSLNQTDIGATGRKLDMAGRTIHDMFSVPRVSSTIVDTLGGGTEHNYDQALLANTQANELNETLLAKSKYQRAELKKHYDNKYKQWKADQPAAVPAAKKAPSFTKPTGGVVIPKTTVQSK